MTGPYASHIRDQKQKVAAVRDFERRHKRNREMDHAHWIYGERRKKRTRRHRDKIAAASRKRNNQ